MVSFSPYSHEGDPHTHRSACILIATSSGAALQAHRIVIQKSARLLTLFADAEVTAGRVAGSHSNSYGTPMNSAGLESAVK